MPMEMLRMIKRTFRDALGKILNSKPVINNKLFEPQQKYLCILMKTHDKCSIYIINKYIHEFKATINKQSLKLKSDFKNDWYLLSHF